MQRLRRLRLKPKACPTTAWNCRRSPGSPHRKDRHRDERQDAKIGNVVRVDRLVKHPVYKSYVRKRTKFMAHNEIDGVSIGDQVRIVETRPLSARKRWRVVEVVTES